jgi:hypothetical protein
MCLFWNKSDISPCFRGHWIGLNPDMSNNVHLENKIMVGFSRVHDLKGIVNRVMIQVAFSDACFQISHKQVSVVNFAGEFVG